MLSIPTHVVKLIPILLSLKYKFFAAKFNLSQFYQPIGYQTTKVLGAYHRNL